jgi:hypothetical protein
MILRKVIYRDAITSAVMSSTTREAATTYWRLMVVVKIVAICAQSVFLVVSRVTRNSFIGVDGFDMGANGVLFCQHGGGGTIGRVGSGLVGGRVVGSHVGYGEAKHSKGARNV